MENRQRFIIYRRNKRSVRESERTSQSVSGLGPLILQCPRSLEGSTSDRAFTFFSCRSTIDTLRSKRAENAALRNFRAFSFSRYRVSDSIVSQATRCLQGTVISARNERSPRDYLEIAVAINDFHLTLVVSSPGILIV